MSKTLDTRLAALEKRIEQQEARDLRVIPIEPDKDGRPGTAIVFKGRIIARTYGLAYENI